MKNMETNDKITVIIPAYNEEENLAEVIKSVDSVLKSLKTPYAIIIMDNASTDATPEIINQFQKENSNIVGVRNPINLGRNNSLLNGLKHVSSGMVCFIDADNQYSAKDICVLREKIRNGADLVCGYRKQRNDKDYRKVLSFFFNTVNKTFFSIKVKDVNCGMKAITYNTFVKCAPQYKKARWFFDTELLVRTVNEGLKIEEVEVQHFERKKGTSKVNCFFVAMETMWYCLLLRLDLSWKNVMSSIKNG